MTQLLLGSHAIKAALEEGRSATRESWPACKKIRPSNTADYDYFNANSVNLEGVIIMDCKAECDCNVAIFQWTAEDTAATDWIII